MRVRMRVRVRVRVRVCVCVCVCVCVREEVEFVVLGKNFFFDFVINSRLTFTIKYTSI